MQRIRVPRWIIIILAGMCVGISIPNMLLAMHFGNFGSYLANLGILILGGATGHNMTKRKKGNNADNETG